MRALVISTALAFACLCAPSAHAADHARAETEIGPATPTSSAASPTHSHEARVPLAPCAVRYPIRELLLATTARWVAPQEAREGRLPTPAWRRLPRMHVDGPVDH